MTDKLPGKPRCPNTACNSVLDGFTALEKGAVPRAGDFSVCAYCSQLMQYNGKIFSTATNEMLKQLSKRERADLERVQTLARFVKKAAEARKKREYH